MQRTKRLLPTLDDQGVHPTPSAESIDAWFESLESPTDDWFAQRCKHVADSNRGSWWKPGSKVACRHCGAFYSVWLGRQWSAEPVRQADKPRLMVGFDAASDSQNMQKTAGKI